MEQEVQEYFEAYFGGQLNESTSDEDIMEAVYDLVALRDAVLEAVGLDEAPTYDVNVHKYEVDHPDDAKRLPKKMKVKVPKDVHRDGKEHIEDYISNHISDTTGFLHHGFSYDKVKKESVGLDEGAKISRDPQLVIGLGKGRPAGRIEKKVKELAPEELAISPERLDDTRKNIRKYLESKKKKT